MIVVRLSAHIFKWQLTSVTHELYGNLFIEAIYNFYVEKSFVALILWKKKNILEIMQDMQINYWIFHIKFHTQKQTFLFFKRRGNL